MKKTGIAAALILWIVSAARIVRADSVRSADFVSAFNSIKYSATESHIDAYGRFESSETDASEREAIVRNFAASIGADCNGAITVSESSENIVTEYEKDNKNAEITIKLISDKENNGQYAAISLTLKNNTDSALAYKELIEEIWESSGIDGYVNLSLCGNIPGAVNFREKNNIAENILKKLGADIVTESRDSDNFVIYAYSEKVEDYAIMSGQKINVNISEQYDEINNSTLIYVSTPFNNLDY